MALVMKPDVNFLRRLPGALISCRYGKSRGHFPETLHSSKSFGFSGRLIVGGIETVHKICLPVGLEPLATFVP